ncbi:hypothetical protein [Pseudoxanthomonas kalamensis]|nr:hypothetical protein [Pseudoxanthomonas kalamensis]
MPKLADQIREALMAFAFALFEREALLDELVNGQDDGASGE